MREHRVQCLLMGGQACVFYGAAEFSRDTDLAVLASEDNATRLREALDALQAEVIAVPPFDLRYLHEGLAVHFRCKHPDAFGMRVDVMSKMRGVDAFPALWERRTTIEMADGTVCDLLSPPDLVMAKKTQRDKDWPMIRRLLEAHYYENKEAPNPDQIDFWLRELRTPSLLIETSSAWPVETKAMVVERPLLRHALSGDEPALEQALMEEELAERAADREYWLPLKKELERQRRDKP